MNKVTKGFLIAACVCIVLGIAIMAGVAACGGAYEVKNVAENGGIGWTDSGFRVGDEADMEITSSNGKEHTYSADEIENLEIELEAGKFEIVEADVDQIIVRSTESVNVSDNGKSISIETPDRFKLFRFWNEDAQKVEIILPTGQKFHKIDLEIGAGELLIESIMADTIIMELGAGRIEAENFMCKEADISIGAGEVIVEEGTAEDMNLDVGMGDFQFKGTITGDLDAECGMGNIDIELAGEEENHNYIIDCGMGNVSVGSSSYGGVASSKVIDNEATSDFDLDCGMGNITISFAR